MSDQASSILVTGASSGVGRATSLFLARQGWRVFGSVRKPADAERLREDSAGKVTPVLFDLADAGSIHRAAAEVSTSVGAHGVNAIVNNAAMGAVGPIEHISLEAVRQAFEVNVFGQLAVTQAFLPLLRQAKAVGGRARIVHIGSLVGKMAVAFVSPISATKFALEAFNDSLRLELHASGIDVVMIHPGSIATAALDKMKEDVAQALAALPPEGRARYGPSLEAFAATFIAEAAKGTPPEKVAEVVHRAVTDKSPSGHYTVDWSTAFMEAVVRLAPEPLLDFVRRRWQHLQ